MSKEGAVLMEAGFKSNPSYTEQEIPLEEGERLVGVRSKMFINDSTHSALHCNMVLIIGRME